MATTANDSLGPHPESLTGGCLCAAVRYRVTFPPGHDFAANSAVCQCTQCRKQTGSLFLTAFQVPASAVSWDSSDPDQMSSSGPTALRNYKASPSAARGFCGSCGSFLFWRSLEGEGISISVGSVDALYLFGEGADEANGVPKEGFGRALCSGKGIMEFCGNEIKGVTDDMPLLFRSKRHMGSSNDA